MMKKILVITLLLFLVACSAPQPVDDAGSPDSSQQIAVTRPSQTTTTKTVSAEVKTLLEKYKSIKSVKFALDSGTTDAVNVYLKGNKYKKEKKLSSYKVDTFDTVYVDRTAKKAYKYCAHPEMCHEDLVGKAFETDFESEDIITPIDLIKQVTYAEIVGEEQIDNRRSIIIEFTNKKGQRERLFVDNFYGFVQQQEIYGSDDKIIEKHTFTNPSFNSVSDEDVSLPEGVKIE